MRKWRSLTRNQSIIFVVSVLALAVGLPSAYWSYKGSRELEEEPRTVAGKVADESGNEAISQVNVSVVGGQAGHDATTDSVGIFILRLTNDVKTGGTARLRFSKTGYVTYELNVPIPQPLPISIALKKQAEEDHAQDNSSVGWSSYLLNWTPAKGGDIVTTMSLISPTRNVRAPMKLSFAFMGKIFGDPRIQVLSDSTGELLPVSWKPLSQKGDTMTLTISDPLSEKRDLYVTVTSKKVVGVGVTCIECSPW